MNVVMRTVEEGRVLVIISVDVLGGSRFCHLVGLGICKGCGVELFLAKSAVLYSLENLQS